MEQMTYSGSVWVEREGEDSAVNAELGIESAAIRLSIGGGVVGEWSVQEVRMTEPESGRFFLTVEGDNLVFDPDDAEAVRSAAAALLFRSRFGATQQSEETKPPGPPVALPAYAPQPTPTPFAADPQKSPGVAAVLSFLIPGVGQMYNGQIVKGLVVMVVQVVNFFLTFVIIGFISGLAVWLWSIFDAYQGAENYNADRVATPVRRTSVEGDGSRPGGLRVEVTVPRALTSGAKVRSAVEPLISGRSIDELIVYCQHRRCESWFVKFLVELAQRHGVRTLTVAEANVDETLWRQAEEYARNSGVRLALM